MSTLDDLRTAIFAERALSDLVRAHLFRAHSTTVDAEYPAVMGQLGAARAHLDRTLDGLRLTSVTLRPENLDTLAGHLGPAHNQAYDAQLSLDTQGLLYVRVMDRYGRWEPPIGRVA